MPLVLPILAAVAGAAAAGVGAIIGGSEAGAALRAVCLLPIKQGTHALAEIVVFSRAASAHKTACSKPLCCPKSIRRA